jgi:deoxyribodipyrimidine photo-lyase
MVSPVIFWFRRDLRSSNNVALAEAAAHGDGDVVPVFVIGPSHPASVGTRTACLEAARGALRETMGGAFVIRWGEPSEDLASVARDTGAREVCATADLTSTRRTGGRAVGAIGLRGQIRRFTLRRSSGDAHHRDQYAVSGLDYLSSSLGT